MVLRECCLVCLCDGRRGTFRLLPPLPFVFRRTKLIPFSWNSQACERLRVVLEALEPHVESETFVRGYGTGSKIPGSFDFSPPPSPSRARPLISRFLLSQILLLSSATLLESRIPSSQRIGSPTSLETRPEPLRLLLLKPKLNLKSQQLPKRWHQLNRNSHLLQLRLYPSSKQLLSLLPNPSSSSNSNGRSNRLPSKLQSTWLPPPLRPLLLPRPTDTQLKLKLLLPKASLPTHRWLLLPLLPSSSSNNLNELRQQIPSRPGTRPCRLRRRRAMLPTGTITEEVPRLRRTTILSRELWRIWRRRG